MIFFSRIHVKRADTSNQRDPGGVKPFSISDEHNPSGKLWCLFHLIDILLFLLSEELLWSQEQLRARTKARFTAGKRDANQLTCKELHLFTLSNDFDLSVLMG